MKTTRIRASAFSLLVVLAAVSGALALAASSDEMKQHAFDVVAYFSLLPPDATPPLDLNKEMMDKYRPAMRQFYLETKPQFQ